MIRVSLVFSKLAESIPGLHIRYAAATKKQVRKFTSELPVNTTTVWQENIGGIGNVQNGKSKQNLNKIRKQKMTKL